MIASQTATWNQLEYVKLMMYSFYRTARIPQDFYVVDNNSEDGTREFLTRLESTAPKGVVNLRVIKLTENIGHVKATEMFWREYLNNPNVKYLFRFKSTTFLPLGIQEAGIRTMEAHPEVGVLGFQHDNDFLAESDDGKVPEALDPCVDVGCIMIRKKIFEDYPQFLDSEIRVGGFMALDFWTGMLREQTKYKFMYYPGNMHCFDFRNHWCLGYEQDRDLYAKLAPGGASRNKINFDTGWLPQGIKDLL